MAELLTRPETRRDVPDVAVFPVLAVAVAVTAVLLAVAGRYGYHRDELYFLAAGRHLAWGYPDQPALVPLLARAVGVVAPGSLVALRVPSALVGGVVAVLAALSAREFGAGRAAQLLAATAMAASGVLLGTAHLLSTATFALLSGALALWLALRATRTGRHWLWLLVGAAVGLGLLASALLAIVMAGVVAALLICGPRAAFRSPWLWTGGLVAVAMWAPYLVWQARHGWPELAVARSIAAGNSTSSTPRALLVPAEFALVGPWLAPVWVVGFIQLLRDRALRWARWVPAAWIIAAAVFVATGGKSYYLAGFFPALLGAGAQPVVGWVRRRRWRRVLLGAAVVLGVVTSVAPSLPLVPVSALHETPVLGANPDAGETVGWPGYVAQIAAAYHRLPAATRAKTALLTSNYGEAGAIDRYGPADHLPAAYSVHNGFWYWGPPPAAATEVLAVGFDRPAVDVFCAQPVLSARLHNPWQVDNQEQGAPLWTCTRLRGSWSSLWPKIKVIG